MTTIAITNRKGGVGKTTHATHIAAGLATIGYNVALVDTDSQGHIALSLNAERSDALYSILVDEMPISQGAVQIPPETFSTADHPAKGNLYLVSSYDKTYKIPSELGEFGTFKFLNLTDELKRQFNLHFVIIDTSPTLKDFDGPIYLATDAWVYVTEAETLAMDGLDKAIKQMLLSAENRKQHLNRATTILGILPNKVRTQTNVHVVGMEELKETYGDLVWQEVRLNTVWAEASLMHETLYTYAPGSGATQDAWNSVSQTIKAVEKWLQGKTN